MEISYSVSALLAELRAPRGITNENFAGSVPIPPVTATALERNFVEAIVNRFIAVAENRPVGADLIISRPKRPLASCHDQLRSIGITAFVIDVDNLSFLEPFTALVTAVTMQGAGSLRLIRNRTISALSPLARLGIS